MFRPGRRQVSSRRGGDGGSWWRRPVAALAVAGLVGVGAWWWWSRGRVAPPRDGAAPTSATNAVPVIPPSPAPRLPPAAGPMIASNAMPLPGTVATNAGSRPAVRISTNIVRLAPPAIAESPDPGLSAFRKLLGPAGHPVRATNWVLAQLALVARGISPGSIDGVGGLQSAEAVRAFQLDRGFEAHGRLEGETVAALTLVNPAFAEYEVSSADLAQLRPVPATWLGKSEVESLGFESLDELVGEGFQTHPNFLRRLNPAVDWNHPRPGLHILVPAARFPPPRRAALIRISLARKWLRVFDERGRLIAHFPCSIAARVEKRPVGGLRVAAIVKDPNYTFDPAVFPESAEARSLGRKLVLNPGPNNPVGVAWIGLDRPGYGIHGTPAPEKVGRTESHGCFRLANWNAEYVRQMCSVGLRVRVEP